MEAAATATPRRPALTGAVDIAENPAAFIFRVDVPGITKKHVQVRIVDKHIQISGERKPEHESPGRQVKHVERPVGKFIRNFELPEGVDTANVSAVCDNGVLTVTLPKIQQVKAHALVPVLSAEEEGDGTLNAAFEAISISVFPPPLLGSVLVLRSDMPLLEAVRLLSKNQILAAPVRDVKQPEDAAWYDKYLGMLDMAGVVLHLLSELKPQEPKDFNQEIDSVDAFRKLTCADASGFARFGPFVPVDVARGNLLDCMLLCGQYGIHRVVAVNSPGGDIVNIVTQSALVATLQANIASLAPVASKTLAELGLGSVDRVYKVSLTQTLLDAFTLIKDKEISAVPVVDETGAIRGNISARDVRLVLSSTKVYGLLHMPIQTYLDVVCPGAYNSAICCTPQDTMGMVIERLTSSRIHRIYVVDAANRPIRVVSLRNVIRKFVKEPEGYFGQYFLW